MLRDTGPVTSSRSAWRGLATNRMPSCSGLLNGLFIAWISSSQPLHEPASTWRIASARPKCLRISCPRRCSSARSAASGSGAGSVTMPVFAICFSSWYISQIRSAVTEVERFVDEWEVRNDVSMHRVLEQRPVLPGGIVRMHSVDAVLRGGFQRDQHLAAPALDPAQAARAHAGHADWRADAPRGQLLHERLDEAHRFKDFIETHCNARRDVAARVRSCARL